VSHPQRSLVLDPSPADALVVKGEFSAAASLYLKAYRENSDPDAAHNLGLMYSRGLGVQKEKSKALDFLMFSHSNRRWDADSWEIDRLSP
jgi:TPR repeat protein